MKFQIGLITAATLFLAGCEVTPSQSESPDNGFLRKVPEGVVALADPSQDLTAVRIDPIDGCYVYRYVGPVETTLLPLRTPDGRPICSRKPDAEVAAAT